MPSPRPLAGIVSWVKVWGSPSCHTSGNEKFLGRGGRSEAAPTDVHNHVFCGSGTAILPCNYYFHKIALLNPVIGSEYEGPLHGHQSIPSRISALLGGTRGTRGSVGGSLHFNPLQSGVVGVNPDTDNSGQVNDYRRPMVSKILPELLETLVLFFGIVGFGHIYSVGLIKEEVWFNSLQILVGCLLIVLALVTQHAVLDLIDFGRISWSHLL